jgi:hypothetical protein
VKLARDPSDVRGGEPLQLAVDAHFLPAHGATFGQLAGLCRPKRPKELAALANGIERSFHLGGFPRSAIR